MKLVQSPEKPEDWKVEILDELIELRDVESENFDFKGTDLTGIYKTICAMANTKGGFLVLGVDENKTDSTTLLGFKKTGFDKGKEDFVNREIRNNIVKIEPLPVITSSNITDGEKFYPVLKIENMIFQKPYFIKEQGVCYVRVGNTSTPASRNVVLSLFANYSEISRNVENLRVSVILLRESLSHTASYIRTLHPTTSLKATPVDLSLIRGQILNSMNFLLEYNLLGKKIVGGYEEGITTFLHKIETLNTYINAYNRETDEKLKHDLVGHMWEWGDGGSNYNPTVDFLNRVVVTADEFLSKNE